MSNALQKSHMFPSEIRKFPSPEAWHYEMSIIGWILGAAFRARTLSSGTVEAFIDAFRPDVGAM